MNCKTHPRGQAVNPTNFRIARGELIKFDGRARAACGDAFRDRHPTRPLVDQLDKKDSRPRVAALPTTWTRLVVHLRLPVRHRRRWRSTNLLERSLGEVGETSCLTLVWAVLDLLITHQTNGIRFSQLDRQRLKRAMVTRAILEPAPTVSECALKMRRRARSAELADLEQMPVGIAKEAADLLATLARRRQESGAPRQ